MKTNKLSLKEIQKAIRKLKQLNKKPIGYFDNEEYILVPYTTRGPIDKSKYRGKGRPRKDDYTRLPFIGFERVK